ncbi:MAG: glycosyltransferase involved in cell wall biosynthesis [Halieaceae bacterium]|jgi:glycosyltransferase involved in cell wall biosynthesis
MKILLIHQNFPGQFKHLGPALVREGHQVLAMPLKKVKEKHWKGIELSPYGVESGSTEGIHRWLIDFETKTIRAEACYKAAVKLREQGFTPDVIIAHPGWGESLFLKDVWPQARLGIYCEFFYRQHDSDVGFDPEFSRVGDDDACRLRFKNLNNLLHFEIADAGLSPTHWQASTFPEPFASRISVIHDGIDTSIIAPNPRAQLQLKTADGQALPLTRDEEIITFVNRNLEPYRGYHVFMRGLPELLRRRPQARVIVVGGDKVSYGSKPPTGTWKEHFIGEVRPQISDEDWSRVHFVGSLAYHHFISLLQISRVHVYLTYPFVLSWSLLEAMSAGCAIVASDTQPLREAIVHDETGRLVDFFDVDGVVDEVCALLEDPDSRARLGRAARAFAQEHYDLSRHCLPRQLAWVAALADSR